MLTRKKTGLILAILILISILMMPFAYSDSSPSGYIKEGNYVRWEKQGIGKIVVYPHTSTGLTEHCQYANITSYLPEQGIDFAFKFSDNVTPENIWYWANYNHHNGIVYGDVQHSYQCNGSFFNYTLNPKVGYCWNDTANGTTLLFSHSFDSGDLQTATMYWTENEVISRNGDNFYDDWYNINDLFTHKKVGNYDFYWIKNVHFLNNELKQIKFCYKTQINSAGKWELMAKRSSDTLTQALSSGSYILLDPWWDAGWSYSKTITIENANSTNTLPKGFTINLTIDTASLISEGKMLSSGDDFRITYYNSTTASYTELDRLNITAFNQNTSILFATQKDIPASTNDTSYTLFYGNPSAGSPPTNHTKIALMYETFEEYENAELIDEWNYFKADTGVSYEGSVSAKHNQSGWNYGDVYYFNEKIGSGDSGVYEFNFYARPSSSSVSDTWIIIGGEDTGLGMADFCFDDTLGMRIRFLDNTYYNLGSYAAQWYKIRILANADSNKGSIWIDDTLEKTGSLNSGWRLDNVSFLNANANYDKMYIRKYLTPEPNTYVSSEQTGNTAPTVEIVSPANNSYTKDSSPSISWNATDPEESLLNCTGWSDNGTIQETFTLNNYPNGTTAQKESTVEFASSYVWFWVECTDGTDSTNSTKINITIDTVDPEITIVHPVNNSYIAHWNLTFNWSIVGDTDSCWYEVWSRNNKIITFENSNSNTINDLQNYNNAYDGNWNTYTEKTPSGTNPYITETYSINESFTSATDDIIAKIKMSGSDLAGDNYEASAYCLNPSTSEYVWLFNTSGTTPQTTEYIIPSSCINSTSTTIKAFLPGGDSINARYYESQISYTPKNNTLDCTTNTTLQLQNNTEYSLTYWANDSAGNYNHSTISFTTDIETPTITEIYGEPDTCNEPHEYKTLYWTQADNYQLRYSYCIFTYPNGSTQTVDASNNATGQSHCAIYTDQIGDNWSAVIYIYDNATTTFESGSSGGTGKSGGFGALEEGGGTDSDIGFYNASAGSNYIYYTAAFEVRESCGSSSTGISGSSGGSASISPVFTPPPVPEQPAVVESESFLFENIILGRMNIFQAVLIALAGIYYYTIRKKRRLKNSDIALILVIFAVVGYSLLFSSGLLEAMNAKLAAGQLFGI